MEFKLGGLKRVIFVLLTCYTTHKNAFQGKIIR
jgi:hypothetical protein